MAVKPLVIHPSALEELKCAISWYLERNKTAAIKLAGELDRAIALVIEKPGRWPAGEHGSRNLSCGASRSPLSIGRSRRRSRYWRLLMGTGDLGTGRIGCERQ